MNKPWFDPDTGVLLFDQYIAEMPSFKKIMADEVITEEELAEQAARVATLLKELDARLSPEHKEIATAALAELAVLHFLNLKQLESGSI